MTIAGCYDLLLECDGEGREAGGYGMRASASWNEELGTTCRAMARRVGWRWNEATGLCRCPSCVKRGAKATP